MPDEPLIADPDLLTSRDLMRAREVLELADPWEKLRDPVERFPFTVWCLKSRSDPGYTYEQALDVPFGEALPSDEPDPPMPPPTGNGDASGHGGALTSSTAPSGSEPEPAASPPSA